MATLTRTIVVGDVHGCGEELLALFTKLEFPREGDRLILVGDLFDRGPLPQLVLETILSHTENGARLGYTIESVCGNHDEWLLRHCRLLYGQQPDGPSISRTSGQTIEEIDRAGMLEDLVLFLENLETIDTIRDEGGRWAVVHAGINPELGLLATPTIVKRTIRAHPGSPAWYDLYDGRDGLIICGHQQQSEPLIRCRDGDPVVINIDTGCCYGRSLTAYLVEDNCFMNVPALRTYYQERP